MLEEFKIRYAILAFLWLQYIWETYLAIRQHRLCQKVTKVPKQLKNVMKEDTFEKARVYMLSKSYFSLIKDTYSIILTTVVFATGALALIWDYAGSVYTVNNEIIQSCIWMFLLQLISTFLNLPFSIYYTFRLEQKHGFNKQTVPFFISDKIKAFVVTQVIGLPLAALVIVIIQKGGDYFFLWLWVFVGIVTLLLLTIYPSYIAPLFDKYTPLPEGALRSSIEKLASELNFPLGQLYVVEGSKRSAHSNAYFYGLLGSKRIVLFDTLLKNPDTGGCSDEEVLAVLSHELGHWKYGHVTKNLIIMQVNFLLMFIAFAYMFRFGPLYTALGFPEGRKPILVGLIAVMQYVLAPYNELLSFMLTALSRKFEFQADEFATKLGRSTALRHALIQLNKDNLSFPIYDNLYSAWHHSHPPLLERLAKLPEKKTE